MQFHILGKDDGPVFDKLVNEQPCVIFVKMDGCYHCENMDNDWNKLQELVNVAPLSKHTGHIIKVDSGADMKSPCVQGITGYPVVGFTHKGKMKKEYRGDRTTEDLQKFIDTSMKTVKELESLNSKLSTIVPKSSQSGGGRRRTRARRSAARRTRARRSAARRTRARRSAARRSAARRTRARRGAARRTRAHNRRKTKTHHRK